VNTFLAIQFHSMVKLFQRRVAACSTRTPLARRAIFHTRIELHFNIWMVVLIEPSELLCLIIWTACSPSLQNAFSARQIPSFIRSTSFVAGFHSRFTIAQSQLSAETFTVEVVMWVVQAAPTGVACSSFNDVEVARKKSGRVCWTANQLTPETACSYRTLSFVCIVR
jgi:hypothetical protein